MAADYWSSTQHRHWLFPQDHLSSMLQNLEDENRHLVQQFPLPERLHLSIFFNSRALFPLLLISSIPLDGRQASLKTWVTVLRMWHTELVKLSKTMSIRQQAIATAHVYIRRYYIKVEVRRTNPYLVMATALYLACKMEECPLHIRVMVSEARNIWPGMPPLSIHSLRPKKNFLPILSSPFPPSNLSLLQYRLHNLRRIQTR